MEIGQKVKKLRELRNFTQEYMAKELNMTPAGYGKIERDESDVTYQKLEKIADILGIKIEDIVNFNEKVIFNQMNNQHATAGYIIHQSISEHERKLYEQIIEQLKEEIAYLRKLIEK